MSYIILLNGASSSGKTTLARSIQHLSRKPWLRLGVDTFVDMMPAQYIAFGAKAKEGYFPFIPGKNERGPTIRVEDGPLGDKVFRCLPAVAKILADAGSDLIIDEVLLGDEIMKEYIHQLNSHTLYLIGVFCDLETMQEREILRGNRSIGLANDQFDRVHKGMRNYDLKVDTTHTSSFAIARDMLDFIDLHD